MTRKIAVVVTARPSLRADQDSPRGHGGHPASSFSSWWRVRPSGPLRNASSVIGKDGFRIASRVFMLLEGETPQTSPSRPVWGSGDGDVFANWSRTSS